MSVNPFGLPPSPPSLAEMLGVSEKEATDMQIRAGIEEHLDSIHTRRVWNATNSAEKEKEEKRNRNRVNRMKHIKRTLSFRVRIPDPKDPGRILYEETFLEEIQAILARNKFMREKLGVEHPGRVR